MYKVNFKATTKKSPSKNIMKKSLMKLKCYISKKTIHSVQKKGEKGTKKYVRQNCKEIYNIPDCYEM